MAVSSTMRRVPRSLLRSRLLVRALCVIALVLFGQGIWIKAKAELAQWLLQYAWYQQQSAPAGSDRIYRPWPWADAYPVGELRYNRKNIQWIVLAGSGDRNLAFAPVFMEGSALPGSPGVSVISAHKDTHFAVLEELRTGDALQWLGSDGRQIDYVVGSSRVVDSRLEKIDLDSEHAHDRLLLVTCYPFDSSVGGPLRKVYVLRPSAGI